MTGSQPPVEGTLFLQVPPAREQTIAKAVVAVTGSLGVAIVAALADGKVTVWEIVLGVLTALGTGAAVWATSNEPAKKL
jgi:hypothetical protein